MRKKLLAVVAHPDDETFAFGGTLAHYSKVGVEVHVLCATRGEACKNTGGKLGSMREQELYNASKILGVAQVELMGFVDGRLSNLDYKPLANRIEQKIASFEPTVVITMDKLGISGHIDHIVIALVTTFVMKKHGDIKFYYYAELKDPARENRDYFIYIPPGYAYNQIDAVINTKDVYDTQVKAMYEHKSQIHDVEWLLNTRKNKPRKEHFIEVFQKTKPLVKKTDLFL